MLVYFPKLVMCPRKDLGPRFGIVKDEAKKVDLKIC